MTSLAVPFTAHDDTHLGVVHLTVRDLPKLTAYYRDNLGLRVHRETPGFVAMGTGGADLLHLTGSPDAPRPARTSGLYHFCLRVPERRDFARWLAHLAETQTPLAGLVDHRFSEAIYLDDPEGNGIELNWDRPRSEWPDPSIVIRLGNGRLDTPGLDALMDGAAPWTGAPPETDVSHIHLHVGSLDEAERFYVGVIGLTRIMDFPGQAVFTSAGGYHHHVAFNVWNGRNIPPKPEGGAGLRSYTIALVSDAERHTVLDRAATAGFAATETPAGPLLRDPAGNGVVLTVA